MIDPAPAQPLSEPLPELPGYRTERLLGRGGFGAVYLARADDNTAVALKVASLDSFGSQRLHREAVALRMVGPPHVPEFLASGLLPDGRSYVAMELVSLPILSEHEAETRVALLLVTADRGLAGAFNSQIIRAGLELAELLRSEGKEPVYYLIGRKSVGYFQFRRLSSEAEWVGDTDTPHFETAVEIAQTLVDAFNRGGDGGGVDEIHLVYNRFVSMMTQTPENVRLLPLEVVDAPEDSTTVFPEYDFEPDASLVLDALLPVYIQSRIFNALLQSSAAKHAATQKAMKSASDNADKLITDYTRLRNNARQAEITQQIAEIVGGADALASGN